MFTGLVQSLGVLKSAAADGHGGRILRVAEAQMAPTLTVGESVAINGACMTVTDRGAGAFEFQVGPESLAKTTLGDLAVGDHVNLERALRAGDPIGGHFVSGHVDVVGRVRERVQNGEWETVWVGFPAAFGELLVPKGSVAVDGVSLTLVDVEAERFSIMLIPHTRENTMLGTRPVGAGVNLEFDLIAKHVQKLFQNMNITI